MDPSENEAGWKYFNEDSGVEWSRNHPIDSGEVPDATEIERMTYSGFRAQFGYDDWTDSDSQTAARSTPTPATQEQEMSCQHLDWSASVGVGNITDEGGNMLGRRTVEVRVHCAACGHPLEFQGLPIGIDTHGPTMSVDGLEARLVAVPKGDEMLASGRISAIFRSEGRA